MIKNLENYTGEYEEAQAVLDEHARDASVFSVCPRGVFYPKNVGDIVAVVNTIAKQKPYDASLCVSVRAGGTCMTGGSLCDGYVLNLTRHMNTIRVDRESRTATVEMGAYFRDIESQAREYGLMFASYPSSRGLCGIGGMIGNNASGEKSLRYGATSENVLELEVVLADGTVTRITPKDVSAVSEAKEVELLDLYRTYGSMLKSAVGDVTKASSGYRLDKVVQGTTFSAIPMFVGAQGTLGIVTKAVLKLVPLPEHLSLLVVSAESMRDIPSIIEIINAHNPEGLETFDRNTWKQAKAHLSSSAEQVEPYLVPDAHLYLLAQFSEDTQNATRAQSEMCRQKLIGAGYAVRAVTNHSHAEALWDVRRNSYLLMRDYNEDGHKAVPCIEDAILPLHALGTFIEELREILKRHAVHYGYHGHIGDGSLRVIPVFDFTQPNVGERITALMEETFALVKRLKGNISADHSDGIIRTPFLREFYGEELYHVFEEIKHIYDPLGILNPQKKTKGTVTHLNVCLDC
jgi:FAD/FMN-containing dehydrogenase